jgi:jumonji domain-containing protein 2
VARKSGYQDFKFQVKRPIE